MPFTSETNLPDNPDVRVFFTGLMILDPNPEPNPDMDMNTCEVFVHRKAADHFLTIEVRRKQAGHPDIIMMRHAGPLAFAPPPGEPGRFGMLIEVGPNPQGVRRYDPEDPDHPSPEGAGFNLAIDLQGAQFHNGSIGSVDPLGGRPSILFNDAVFYTAVITGDHLDVGLIREEELLVPKLPPFASVIGANIYLDKEDPDSAVFVQWRQEGLDQVLTLKKQEEGISYEIYIANEPLYEDEESLLPRHEEFAEYYNILPQVPTNERFRLDIPKPPAGTPRGSTTTPCMPVVKGG
jgi:hypothetical protein